VAPWPDLRRASRGVAGARVGSLGAITTLGLRRRSTAHAPKKTGQRLYRRLMLEARPYRLHIAGLFGLSLLSSAFALLAPLPLMIAVDSVVGSRPLPGFIAVFVPAWAAESQTGVLLVAAALFVFISLLKQLQQFGTLVLSTYAGEKLLLDFRTRVFRHAERLTLAYHDSKGAADSTYRIQYDASAIQSVAVTGLIPFFTAVVTVVGMIYVTARIDWQLALVSLGVTPILFLALRMYRTRLRARWHDAKRLESSALSVVQESLEALRVVKAFGREDDARDRFASRSSDSVRAKIDLAFVEGRFGIVIGVTIGLGMGTVLFLGTGHVLAGTLTLGELVLVMGYLQQLYDPLKTASKKAGALQSSLASAERVYSLLDETPDFVDPPDARPLKRAAGAVAFRGVSFAYDPGHLVLDGVSFEVPPGTRLGIAGTTGAGKTTLVSLLTRFYDPQGGEILLDGVDLRRYRLADLRNQFAIVLQEPVLFSASIAENIAYAQPGADEDDLIAAAKAAHAHDFIQALPDGYATLVGQRGARLSGGERQRIALARAFLKDAPILILDEPTSSVDARTESEILDAMERLMRGRTALMIAHRPSTLAICDARVELELGRVVPRISAAPRRARRAPHGPPTRRREVQSGRTRGKRLPLACDPVKHPVARAWQTLAPTRACVERIDLLRQKRRGEIYRLAVRGVPTGVIAKRGRSEALQVERTIYESVLPRLRAPALRYFGFVAEEEGSSGCLFIEDGGDERCAIEQHSALAAQWLGALHGGAASLDLESAVPERGPAHYLEHLRAARTRILENFYHPALARDDKVTLQTIVTACDLVQSRWSTVEAMCEGLPRTLVHGDLADRNVRLLRDDAGPALVAFDWEWAGYGVPAADVYMFARGARRKDLLRYRSTVSHHTRELDEDEIGLLSLLGNGFRLLASIDWASLDLGYPRPERGMASLHVYGEPLQTWAGALEAAA
jgi:ATP-binding cassette, subfamily B, bacterial